MLIFLRAGVVLSIEVRGLSRELWYVCRRAVAMRPQSASYALNLMHALELELAYNEALDVAAAFCRSTTCLTLDPRLDLQVACAAVAVNVLILINMNTCLFILLAACAVSDVNRPAVHVFQSAVGRRRGHGGDRARA